MDWKRGRLRAAGILVAAGLALAVAGCDTVGYYYQSIGGHLGVMAQAQSLDEAIAGAQASNDTRWPSAWRWRAASATTPRAS